MIKLADYQKNGSGWYFKEVISFEIHIVDYKPIKGSSYIPLPEFLLRKKAIINMENKDDKCFLWCVLRYLHPVQKNASRINDLREYENDLNFKGIDFPIRVKDIQKFENPNPNLPGIQNCMMKKFQMKTINMQSMFGILSIVKLFKITTIFISKLMFFFLQTYLKISEKLARNITNLIHVIIIQRPVLLGMLVSKKQNKIFSFLKITIC